MFRKGSTDGVVRRNKASSPSSSPSPSPPPSSLQNQSQSSSSDVAAGCIQGCAFSFLWMLLFQSVLSVLDALGVPCAAPLAAGCIGGACGAVNASRRQQHPHRQHHLDAISPGRSTPSNPTN